MRDAPLFDPLALMRLAIDQWEKLGNELGADLLQRPETVQAMQQYAATYLQAQKFAQEVMAKALASANLPSLSDLDAISRRLSAIEASLARIEAAAEQPRPSRKASGPPRTRKPPIRS